MPATTEWSVNAVNHDFDSENRIHSDEVARQYGFRAGLVPGATVYGYLTRPVVARWGRPWLTTGWCEVRFVSPVYHGDRLDMVVHELPGELRVDAVRETDGVDGVVVATGRFRLDAGPPPDPATYIEHPLPATRYPAQLDALSDLPPFGAVRLAVDAAANARAQREAANDLDLYDLAGLAYPTLIADGGNQVMKQNLALGPWMHIRSVVWNHAPIAARGEALFVPRVIDVFERRRNQRIVLDIGVFQEGRLVARTEHESVFRMTPPEVP